ncbi:MAG: ABC transporter ATP-binding protein [Chloroflexi bacterium]|nr:ABC transporter ATP-binding protein [Chloroflexota bacterium]
MLSIENVSHAYEDHVSLRKVNLQVEPGEIVCLLGPSGCGKTTLLRIIAGLETALGGQVSFDGVDISDTPVHRREFGLMFQDFALFPHMNVADNVAYGLKRRGQPRRLISGVVESLLDRVGLAELGGRDIASLSGGQKQRVALARSLAPRPRLLMLDEPLGSLDAQLRDQLALELRQIIKDEGIRAIYVTHDHREAYAVADRIAVMNIGSIEQVDTPERLYHWPGSSFVASFLGMRNIFDTRRNNFARRICSETLPDGGAASTALIHPAGIRIGRSKASTSLLFDAVLKTAVFRGDYFDVSVSLDDGTVLYFVISTLPVAIGGNLTISIAPDAVIALDA